MYVEHKPSVTGGEARIGRVTYSKSGSSITYRERRLMRVEGGYKHNHMDEETGEHYWVSGCKKRGGDRLYSGIIEIDEDIREEYWTSIRNKP